MPHTHAATTPRDSTWAGGDSAPHYTSAARSAVVHWPRARYWFGTPLSTLNLI